MDVNLGFYLLLLLLLKIIPAFNFNTRRYDNYQRQRISSSELCSKQPLRSRDHFLNTDNVRYGIVLSRVMAVLTVGVSGQKVSAETETENVITDVVYLDVKIANYTEESVGTNKGAEGSGRIIIGLYGKAAPQSVERFLTTLSGDGLDLLPNYYGSQFTKIIDGVLLDMDKVRGVNTVTIAGSEQYEFNGRVLSSFSPILENSGNSHNKRGYLTRRKFSGGAEFGITMNDNGAEKLDELYTVFGKVIQGDEVLDAIDQIPKYSYSTATGYGGREKGVAGGLADKWFEGQRAFYVDIGRSLGDQRAVDMRGRLLRRVTIKGFGKLENYRP